MTENEFLLADRIAKIKSMNEQYDLENRSYISFSGGKDSTVLHYLIDQALPGNKIPRVYLNTGIEYKFVVEYVKEMAETDNRIVIVNSGVNIKQMLEEVGYPFKSKEHSLYLSVYQNSGNTKTVTKYLTRTDNRFACPDNLRYQFTPEFKLHISNKCCYKLKKDVAEKWRKENGKEITITGMRSGESGLRAGLKGCAIFNDNDLVKFHPLQPVSEDFINWFVEQNNIKLCKLYYSPYNFERTGCKGCPYAINLQEQLDMMAIYMPDERKQCEMIWKPVYEEYRRIGWRLYHNKNLFE